MLVSTKAIVISKIKYKDNDLIVKCYTEQFGIQSYLLRGILKSKKGRLKTAYFQLLSQLHLVVNYKQNRSLQSINDVRPNIIYQSIYSSIPKSAVAMFLAELLSTILKEEEQNSNLFTYLETTLSWFDNHHEFSNFHLLFLLKLTKHLGCYPDTKNSDWKYFNLEEGKFQSNKSGKYIISGSKLTLLKHMLGINFDTLNTIKFDSQKRLAFLNMILLYFELHLGSTKRPKSLQILNQVFA